MTTKCKAEWTVQDRHGWGWSAYTPEGMPGAITPISSRSSAQVYCDARNAGRDHQTAWNEAKASGGLTREEYVPGQLFYGDKK